MSNTFCQKHASQDWLPFDYFDIPLADELIGDQLESWLGKTLLRFPPSADFTAKVLASVWNAAAIVQAEAVIRLLVYAPTPLPMVGKAWGFFCTIRNEETPADIPGKRHIISLYLYVEEVTKPGSFLS
jgi:hypothetical protein